jgi:hypothetical protein
MVTLKFKVGKVTLVTLNDVCRLPTQSWPDAPPGHGCIKDRSKPSTDGCHDDQSHSPTRKDGDEEGGCVSLVEGASRSNDVTLDAVDQASMSASSYIPLPPPSELWDEDDDRLPDKDSLEGDSLVTKRASIECAVAEARKRQQCSETPCVREAAMPEKRPRRTGLRERHQSDASQIVSRTLWLVSQM